MTARVVQKFGGSSVADPAKIMAAARKAVRAKLEGNQVVVVVSAMGDSTDHLIDLAAQITERPSAREMDMLLSTGEQVSVALMAMAIHRLGHESISLTGAQIGIRTDSTHRKARIKSISTERIVRLLDAGHIVIAAGFQGIDEDFNITTLGRGGSDTTAVALAAVLGATSEIYTDVDGIYSTDPRIVPEARRVDRISYDEMLELASLGAGVMHSRSIEFGKKFNVPIRVRSSFSDLPGTLIAGDPESAELPVCGAAIVRSEARVTIADVPDRPGVSMDLFARIAARNIAVDMIVQNVGAAGRADLSFTVLKDELAATLEVVTQAVQELPGATVKSDDDVSKISVVGLGMERQTGVAQRMFRSLADAGINIQMVATGEIKISALVKREQAFDALRVVHAAFGLANSPATKSIAPAATPTAVDDAAAVVARLQAVEEAGSRAMEDVTITDIALDADQGRVTITGVPDKPGLAAAIFEGVASRGILVDLIVQTDSTRGLASMTFTCPQANVAKAAEVCRELSKTLKLGDVSSEARVAKLSVTGTGMRSHTGVAARMFKALAESGINLSMISTSEVRVAVVVAGSDGASGLAALEKAFAGMRQ